MTNKTPPTTPFVCNIGVTGHRDLAVESIPAITQTVADVLAVLREHAASQLTEVPKGLYSSSRPIWRCISPLANGTDRIVARQALAQGYEIQAPLPFGREEYEKDFREEASRQEFRELLGKASAILELDGNRAAQGDAYLAAGRIVLEQSDILITVWNGAEAKGRGGTGQIVAEAQRRGIPVLVIDPAEPAAIRCLSPCNAGNWNQDLKEVIGHLLLPPAPPTEAKSPLSWRHRITRWATGGVSASTKPSQYFAETLPRPTLLGRFPVWFEKMLAREKLACGTGSPLCSGFWKGLAACWNGFCALLPGKGERNHGTTKPSACAWCDALGLHRPETKQIERTLTEHYDWADLLAIHYAAHYRAVGFLRHLLMVVVIVGLFIGFYIGSIDALGFGFQVLGFAGILFLIRINKVRNWQQRFLDYRYMAEQLRHLRYLFLLGRVPSFAYESADATCTRESWPAWHLRNVARQAGLVHARMEPALLATYRQRLDADVIADQIGFYTARQCRYDTIARRLNTIGMRCFIGGLAFILLRFIVFYWVKNDTALPFGIMGSSLRTLLNEIALVIPSVASMVFAIRSQGEYTRLGMRYARTRMVLVHKQKALRDMAPLTSTKLADFSKTLAELLSREVSGWHVLVKSKVLSPY
jgi:hypothetical protein